METILHSPRNQGRPKHTAKTSMIVSVILHLLFFGVGAFWAAREGMLGKQMKELSVLLVPKEKKLEPKKPDEKPPDAAKPVEEVKKVIQETVSRTAKTLPPPPPKFVAAAGGPAVAAPPPPPAAAPLFVIGGDDLPSDNSPEVVAYKSNVEYTLRSRWNRPMDLADEKYVAEVELALDSGGRVVNYAWMKGSGDARWDNSVRQALDSVRQMPKPPPKGFPDKVTVRFDVVAEGDVIQ